MTETVTTIAFKKKHGLSDSAFKRLVRKVKEENPDVIVTERLGSTEWVIRCPELLEDVLGQRATPITPEVLDTPNTPESIVPYTNGFTAKDALRFTVPRSSDVVAHIEGEVIESGQAVKESLQAFFYATQEADEELGAYLGAKRLERVLGTADSVFMRGLENRAQTQGLGKQEHAGERS